MARQKRVIVLVPNADLRGKLLYRLTQTYKWVQFVGAGTLTEARGLVSAEPTDLIVVDLHQNELPPVEVVQRLKRDHAKVELLGLTRPGQEAVRRSVFEAGAAYVLTVPTDPATLQRTMTEALTTPRLYVTRIANGFELCNRIVPCLDARENITVVVEGGAALGELYLAGGSVVGAAVGELAGERALEDILNARDCDVFVRTLPIVPKRTVTPDKTLKIRTYAADDEAYWQSRPESVRKHRVARAVVVDEVPPDSVELVDIQVLDEGETTDTPAVAGAEIKLPAEAPPIEKMVGRKLGKVLYRLGKVQEEGLRKALIAQLRDKGAAKRVGYYLVKLGACTAEDVRFALAVQQGVKPATVPLDVVDTDASPPASISRTGPVVPPTATPAAAAVEDESIEEISVEVVDDAAASGLPETAAEVVSGDSKDPGARSPASVAGVGARAPDLSDAETDEGPTPLIIKPSADATEADIRTVEPEDDDIEAAEEVIEAAASPASEAPTDSGPVAPIRLPPAPPEVTPDVLLEVPEVEVSGSRTDVQLSPDDFIPAEQLRTGSSVGTAPVESKAAQVELEPTAADSAVKSATPGATGPASGSGDVVELLEPDPTQTADAVAAVDLDKTTVASPARASAAVEAPDTDKTTVAPLVAASARPADTSDADKAAVAPPAAASTPTTEPDDDKTTVARPIGAAAVRSPDPDRTAVTLPVADLSDSAGADEAGVFRGGQKPTRSTQPDPPAVAASPATPEQPGPAGVAAASVAVAADAPTPVRSEPDSVEDVLDDLWAAKSQDERAARASTASGSIFAPADSVPAAGPARLEHHCGRLLAEVDGALAAGIVCLRSGLLLASRLADEYPSELVDLPAAGFVELFRDRIFRRIDDAVRRQAGNGAPSTDEVLFTGAATHQLVRKFPQREAAMVLVLRRGQSPAAGWESLRAAMEAAQPDVAV
jgi:CheY-like chemotaxis protein